MTTTMTSASVNGIWYQWHGQMTVQGVLDFLNANGIYDVVTVNREVVLSGNYSTFVVPDGAEIRLTPMVTGG